MASPRGVFLVLACFTVSLGRMTILHPLRTVITTLEKMKASVEEEGRQEQKEYQEFMCYCKKNMKEYRKNLAEDRAVIKESRTSFRSTKQEHRRVKRELREARKDRRRCRKELKRTKSMKKKELSQDRKTKKKFKENDKAVCGMMDKVRCGGKRGKSGKSGNGFLQESSLNVVRNLVLEGDYPVESREAVLSFLADKDGESMYAGKSGSGSGKSGGYGGGSFGGKSGSGSGKSGGYGGGSVGGKSGSGSGKSGGYGGGSFGGKSGSGSGKSGGYGGGKSGGKSGGGKTDQICGCFKQIDKDLKDDIRTTEKEQHKHKERYDELIKTKARECESLTKTIEKKMATKGDLAVKKTELKAALKTTKKSRNRGKSGKSKLRDSCSTKTAEWEERSKIRQEELVTLTETLKVLGSDDALYCISKASTRMALEQNAVDFLQLPSDDYHALADTNLLRKRALSELQRAHEDFGDHVDELNLITTALEGQAGGFNEVIGMIDALIKNLNQEQQEERTKRNSCVADIDRAEDKAKEIKATLQEASGKLDMLKEEVQTGKKEISSLDVKIQTLETRTEDVTVQRQHEHASSVQTLTQETSAINLLKYAESRLLKFYNHKDYQAGGALTCPSFAQQWDYSASDGRPTTFGKTYVKKSESLTVTNLIHSLVVEFEKEISVVQLEERKSQASYEETVHINRERSHEYEVMVAQKTEQTVARTADVVRAQELESTIKTELVNAQEFEKSLVTECDWLVQNYDLRRQGRRNEIDSLTKAKSVLKGSDASALPVRTPRVHSAFLAA